jgi:hypothetical protein
MAEQTFSPREAREQAAEYLGMLASVKIAIEGGEVFEVPNPSLLDNDQQQRYDELQFSLEALDRWPDTKDADGNLIRRGEPLEPHRQKGKLVESYNVRLAKALFGDEGYKRFSGGGGRANDIAVIWFQMQKRLTEAAKQDPK